MAWTKYADGTPVNWLERQHNGVVNFELPGEDYGLLSLRERLKRQSEYMRQVWKASGHQPPKAKR